jgi:hypothetical protein
MRRRRSRIAPRLVSGRILPCRFHPGEPSRCCVSASLSYQDQAKKKCQINSPDVQPLQSAFPRPCTQLVAKTCKTNRLLNARASCSVAYGKQCAVPARSSSEPEGGEHVPSWTSLRDGWLGVRNLGAGHFGMMRTVRKCVAAIASVHPVVASAGGSWGRSCVAGTRKDEAKDAKSGCRILTWAWAGTSPVLDSPEDTTWRGNCCPCHRGSDRTSPRTPPHEWKRLALALILGDVAVVDAMTDEGSTSSTLDVAPAPRP